MQDKLYDMFKEFFDLIPNNSQKNIDDIFNEFKSVIQNAGLIYSEPEQFKDCIAKFLIEKFEDTCKNHILDGVITS